MSKCISIYAPHQTVKIPNLEQYVAVFPKGTGTEPVPKKVRKIPALVNNSDSLVMLRHAVHNNVALL